MAKEQGPINAAGKRKTAIARATVARGQGIDLQIDQLLPLRGSLDEMTAIIEKAQAIVEQYGTAEQRGQFFQAVVARDGQRDRYVVSEETVSYCRNRKPFLPILHS